MVEIELKFQIDEARREDVRRALASRSAAVDPLRLQARYFDTVDERLTEAGLALRLRKEGPARWVQTLKGRGDGLMQRLEHEIVLLPGDPVAIDVARHEGTAAGQALHKALGTSAAPLVERFATDIRRSRRVVRTRSAAGVAASVEIALDEGWLLAPAAAGVGEGQPAKRARRRLPVLEIEFELLAGPPQALLDLAARWVRRHGLWLDVRSKAERGHALATGRWPGAVFAQPPVLARRMAPASAFAAMLQSALAHVLPNMAAVAEAAHADAEHLHQLRVGLRRLRTLLREFAGDLPGLDAAAAALVLREVFSALGALRDREIIEQTLRPARAAARAAGVEVASLAGPPGASPDAALRPLVANETAPLRMPAFNVLLLTLVGACAAPEGGAASAAPTMLALATKRLARLHKRVAADAARFAAHDDEARHALRKRLKRLRYSLEFVAPLYARKPMLRYLAVLKPAQQALGDFNDLVVAQTSLRNEAAPEAFVLGWLAARREALEAQAAKRLVALTQAPRFWKGKD